MSAEVDRAASGSPLKLGRMTAPATWRSLLYLAAGLALTAAAACGGDGDSQTTRTIDWPSTAADGAPTGEATNGSSAYSGVIVTVDLATGPNRFAVAVIGNESIQPVQGADVSLRFYKLLQGNEGELRAEAEAQEVIMDRFYVDEVTGRTVGSGQIAVYVANPAFDETGDWGVEIAGAVDGRDIGQIALPFEVKPPEHVFSVGDPAPKSRQAIASDVEDVLEIDTMQPPDSMHEMTIEDAVTSGKPSVIFFGTPAFCEKLTCGPVLQTVVLPLYQQYNDVANFVHVEPFFLEPVRSGAGFCAVPAYNVNHARAGFAEGPGPCPALSEEELQAVGESWNLTSEPVLFVVDGEGVIAGKFEAVVSPAEVEEVLAAVLG
jgi:hypothetical protein